MNLVSVIAQLSVDEKYLNDYLFRIHQENEPITIMGTSTIIGYRRSNSAIVYVLRKDTYDLRIVNSDSYYKEQELYPFLRNYRFDQYVRAIKLALKERDSDEPSDDY